MSDITYEELTPLKASVNLSRITSSGRTLPMRNWHKLTYLVIDSQRTLVGHYLWGIDTFNPMVANCKATRSRILSDITYEELTHVDWYRLNHQLRCRTLPMRNWHKHSNSLMHWYLVRMYSRTLPMRNWHLDIIDKVHLYFCNSSRTLPMRNWHTAKIFILSFIFPCRTLPMRNWHWVWWAEKLRDYLY